MPERFFGNATQGPARYGMPSVSGCAAGARYWPQPERLLSVPTRLRAASALIPKGLPDDRP